MTRRNTLFLIASLALGIAVRVWFLNETHLTLEDSLITFRYAENLADGRGFVYNEGERVLGTTTPLWASLLAIADRLGSPDTTTSSRWLAIVLDAMTAVILFTTFQSPGHSRLSLIWAAIFMTSSGIVPINMSGMESPLLLFSMALTVRGLALRNRLFPVGMAMTILTRMDGLIFVACMIAAAGSRDMKWTLRQAFMAALLLAPWTGFSVYYFGDLLPQSMRAKMSIYALGLHSSADPFIDRFTPIGETSHLRFMLKSVSSVFLIAGIIAVRRKNHLLLPVAVFFLLYSLIFMTSGGLIFPWYLTPATFAYDLLLAAGLASALDWIGAVVGMRRARALLILILACVVVINIRTLQGRLDEYREMQRFEEELRAGIGKWLRENAADGSSVFLEPIGYIGYHAGPGVRIIDQMGLVSPEVAALRKKSDSWYMEAIRKLRPEYIIEYTRSLEENLTEGTSSPLFADQEERTWFNNNYETVRLFETRELYPHLEEKEKSYTLLKRRCSDQDEQ